MNKLSMFLAGSALALMVTLPQLSRATGGGQSMRMSVNNLARAPDSQTPMEEQNARIAALESKLTAMQGQITALQQDVAEANKKIKHVDYKVSCHWHRLPTPTEADYFNQAKGYIPTKGYIDLFDDKQCDPGFWE